MTTGRLLYLIAALVISDVLLQAEDFRLRDESTTHHTLRFSGGGARSLTLRNVNGSIRVTGSNDSTVEIDVRRVVRADTRADLQRGRDEDLVINGDSPNLEVIARDPNGAVCGERSRRLDWRRDPPYSVEYQMTVSVPAGTRLIVCTINGSEEILRTSGDFDVQSVNGRIAMRDVRGSGNVKTVNGGIEASFQSVPTSDSRFETVNGSVEVTWPASLSADLRMKTTNGGLYTDFDMQTLPTQIAAGTRRNGRFVYRSNNTANVRVGQGGPQISLESLNGDVRILRASR
jgi:hypothetical protein